MPQTPAYSAFQVVATGTAMLQRGEVPDPKGLHRALGGRGNPLTAWRSWEQHAGQCQMLDRVVRFPADEVSVSPALKAARKGLQASLLGLMERERAEATEPLKRRIAALERMLDEALARCAMLEDLVAMAYPDPAAAERPTAEAAGSAERALEPVLDTAA